MQGMQGPTPFRFGQIQNLTNLGLDPQFFKFNVTHLESERYVAIRDVDANGAPQLTVVELFNKFNITRRPGGKIQGSIMHLKDNIVALKAPMEGGKGHILQVFNMERKEKLSNLEFPDNIVFWRWVTEDILGVVTTTAVYHVSIATPNQKEVKIFERSGQLKEGQIIGYCLGPDRKWSALFGISTPDGGKTINGHIQLYFIEGGKQQLLEGHACTFGKVLIHSESQEKSNVFCFVERKAGQTRSLVHVTQISAPPQGAQKFKKNNQIVYDPSTPGDFPINLIVAEKYGLLYIVTKFGFIYIYELTTVEQIYKARLSNQAIFAVAKNQTNDGILALSKNGSLLGGMIDEQGLVPHLMNNCRHLANIQQVILSLANYNIDYTEQLKNMVETNPEGAVNFAKKIYKNNKNLNIHQIADLFLQKNRIQEFTSLLFDCMRQNKPEDASYQTKVLEVNIMIAPHIAESILQMKIWNLYNKPKIAALCEQKGLYQRALENYTDIKDIKRVLINSHSLSPEFIGEYLGKMDAEQGLVCMQEMLRFNRQNLQVVVNVAVQNLQKFGAGNIVKMLESVGSFNGIFFFLGTVINSTTDKEVHHKYIQAAAKCGQLRAIEDVIRGKRECYDPIKVKDILLELKLTDPKPIIFLCDAHQQYDELTRYLYKNNFTKYIEVYLFKVCQNPQAIPIVLGTLIDLECDESYIQQILKVVRSAVPMEELIHEFERRSKLSIMEGWLDDRVSENIQIAAVHNAMAKLKVDTHQDPQKFLQTNQFYDPKVIGKFCEDRDPHLAVIAYKRNPGMCDVELIDCTNRNSLYRIQAQYLVTRQNKELWLHVLNESNEHRKEIVDQVISTELPESRNPEEVITAVQSFMESGLTTELMSLLEKIVLHNSDFAKYKKLQNLLIITAIRSQKSRVMDYINRLDNYDGMDIAKIALEENLFEQVLVIYRKYGEHNQALDILIEKIGDLQRAEDYAEKVNQPEVWSKLGYTYLSNMNVTYAMEAFLKCKDHTYYNGVIGQIENEPESEEKDFKYPLFIKYLLMVRQATKDQSIDNALTFSYAKLDKLTELENFLSNTNSADCQKVGDRCFSARLYDAAKKFYIMVKNNSKIAACLIHLKQFSAAIDAAKKANTTKTWKEVCMACVAAQEYKLANTAAMNIIIHADELEGLIKHYESLGVTNEMISILEAGVGLDRAHIGIFTELAILYAKYRPEKLMDHCKNYLQKLNTTKLLRACQKFMLWKEAVYLYSHYNEFDQAVNIMIEHSPIAYNHETFLQLIVKVSNTELYYKSISFYLEEQPLQINELLKTLANKIDLVKCTSLIRRLGIVQLCENFLKIVQQTNTKEINEALNELYLDIEDYQSLRESIEKYPNIDSYNLAKATENHALLEFRRIAALLYRQNGKYEQSIKLSKKDQIYRDAIETAQESDNQKIVEELLKFFVEKKEKEFFAATLYTCYEYVKPDLALEYAWRFNMYEFVMPFIIQMVSEMKTTETKKEQTKEKEKVTTTTLDFVSHDLEMMMPGQQLMLTGGGGSGFHSTGGMAPPQHQGMMPPGGSTFGGYPNPNSPYQPR